MSTAFGLPPPPLQGAAETELSLAQRRWAVGGIVVAHLVGAWALMQVQAVREAVLQATPIFVRLMPLDAAPLPPLRTAPVPLLPAPPTRSTPPPPVPLPLPLPLPMLTTAPSPALATFSVPAPRPELPQPPQPVSVVSAVGAVAASPSPPAPAPMPAPAPAPAPAPRVIPASAVQYTVPPDVVYPRLSKRYGEAGRVLVRAFVDAAGGAPRSVQVSQSSGHARLDEAALSAVQKARFKPYTDNGQPVEGWALIPIDFELEK